MSNSQAVDMISAPREEVERLVKLLAYQSHPYPSPHAEYWQGVLDAPVQHQGEPVALPARKPWSGLLATADNLKGDGWNACLNEIAKLGPLYAHPAPADQQGAYTLADKVREALDRQACPNAWMVIAYEAVVQHFQAPAVQQEPMMWANQLGDTISNKVKSHNLSIGGAPAGIAQTYTQPLYTHADPGEVERLRRLVDTKECERQQHLEECAAEVSALRAQLAERDALLIESHDLLNSGHLAAVSTYARQRAYSLIDKIKAVISASAEPEVKS